MCVNLCACSCVQLYIHVWVAPANKRSENNSLVCRRDRSSGRTQAGRASWDPGSVPLVRAAGKKCCCPRGIWRRFFYLSITLKMTFFALNSKSESWYSAPLPAHASGSPSVCFLLTPLRALAARCKENYYPPWSSAWCGLQMLTFHICNAPSRPLCYQPDLPHSWSCFAWKWNMPFRSLHPTML